MQEFGIGLDLREVLPDLQISGNIWIAVRLPTYSREQHQERRRFAIGCPCGTIIRIWRLECVVQRLQPRGLCEMRLLGGAHAPERIVVCRKPAIVFSNQASDKIAIRGWTRSH